jgi:uncharacterized protein
MVQTPQAQNATLSVEKVRSGTSEQGLAGPSAPSPRLARISHLDTIRGLAVMGILVSNIHEFGGVSIYPPSSLKPTFSGPHAPLNYILFVLQQLVFNSKTRGLLAMIFGAGVLLLVQRVEAGHGKRRARQIFVRRHAWMIVIGLLHAFFLWDGDFIASYGVVALLLLYICRRWSAQTQILAGVLITLLPGSYALMYFHPGALEDVGLAGRVAVARAEQRLGKPLDAAQAAAISAWERGLVPTYVSRDVLEERVRNGQKGYSARIHQKLSEYFRSEVKLISVVLFESGGMALLGMGLLKTGFLTGELSKKTYVWTALLGLLASFPLLGLGLWEIIKADLPPELFTCWIDLPQQFTRIGATLAYAALIVLWVQSGCLKPAAAAFSHVGRMALTNYLMTSAICQFVFAWGPWKLFGELEYFQLFWCVLGVWTVNLIFSCLWLRYFAFGPLEWVWRSLTYAKMPPMMMRDAGKPLSPRRSSFLARG